MKPAIPEIRKEAFIQAREKLGLSIADLAQKACLSTKQVEQIERGGLNLFYSVQNKYSAAKKIAAILGLKEVLAFEIEPSIPELSQPKSELPLAEELITQAPVPETENTVAVAAKKVDAMIDSSKSSEEQLVVEKKSRRPWMMSAAILLVLLFVGSNAYQHYFLSKPQEAVMAEALPENAPPADLPPQAPPPTTASMPAAVVPPVPSPVTPASAISPSDEACPAADSSAAHYKPESPRKSGDMVYVQAKSRQVVCVVDGAGKTQNKVIDPGAGNSFYGKPPFKVLTAGLEQVDIFYQGARVHPENANGRTLVLDAGDLSSPSSSAPAGDAGVR